MTRDVQGVAQSVAIIATSDQAVDKLNGKSGAQWLRTIDTNEGTSTFILDADRRTS